MSTTQAPILDDQQLRTGASLKIENLSRFYGDVKAVDGLDLEIPAGTFLTLLGPSGCGKSTTLALIAGLDKPDGGQILLGDTDITHLPPNDRGMAMVFQSYALYPHMTVRENIAFGLKMRRRPKDEIAARVVKCTKCGCRVPQLYLNSTNDTCKKCICKRAVSVFGIMAVLALVYLYYLFSEIVL